MPLFDAYGRVYAPDLRPQEGPRRRVSREMGTPTLPPPYADRFQTRLGSALTPDTILNALRHADHGYLYSQVDMLEEALEMDGHLAGIVAKRIARVASAPWEMFSDDRSLMGREARDFCREVLENIDPTGKTELGIDFYELIAHLLGACYYPSMAAETVYRRDGRWVIPSYWLPIHPRRLSYATSWKLYVWNPQPGYDAMYPEKPSPTTPADVYPGVCVTDARPGKFVRYRANVRPGGYPTRDGMGRLTIWFAAFKRWDIRDMMAFAEQFARGIPTARYTVDDGTGIAGQPVATDEDVQNFERALQRASPAYALLYPNSISDVKFHTSQGAGVEVYRFIHDTMSAEMSKAILGSTLTTEPGRKGARSLGDIHAEVEERQARAEAQKVANTVRNQILRPLVRMNFGPSVGVPEIRFDVASSQARFTEGRIINTALMNGVPVPEAWAMKRMGIRAQELETGPDGTQRPERTLAPRGRATT